MQLDRKDLRVLRGLSVLPDRRDLRVQWDPPVKLERKDLRVSLVLKV